MPQDSETKLSNAAAPMLYGTAWKEDATQRCVRDALAAGFRAIDTANQRKHYYEAAVGNALIEAYDRGTITRADLFLQTKFTQIGGQDHRLPYDPGADLHTQVLQSFASSLDHLHTNYIDSYVLHGPSTRPGLHAQDWAVWRAMEQLNQQGKTKFLGISNVVLPQLEELCGKCSIKPSFVQNRCYARTGWDLEVRTFCNANNIRYQGFSLLTANPEVLQDRRITELSTRYSCTPAQLVFAFAIRIGMVPLTGTKDPIHMREDLAAQSIEIGPDDVALIERIAAT